MIFALLIISAETVKESCYRALQLCGSLIIPSLFPFFVLSAYITKLGLPSTIGRFISPFAGRLYKISPSGASALIMGFVGGYPAGAAYIAELEKDSAISAQEGEKLIAFCNNSGPAFIVGVIGCGIFGSVRIGVRLYLIHILSALLTGIFFRADNFSQAVSPHRLDTTNTSSAVVSSVKQAVSSILNVCGFVVSFYVLISIFDTTGLIMKLCTLLSRVTALPLDFSRVLLIGALELGSGAAAMQTFTPSPLNLALAAAMLGWGGLSVHFQTLAVLSESNIKGTLHTAGRLISAILAFILMSLISYF